MDVEMNGKLLETFVFNQLAAYLDVHEGLYQLTQYRDGEQREVDFIFQVVGYKPSALGGTSL